MRHFFTVLLLITVLFPAWAQVEGEVIKGQVILADTQSPAVKVKLQINGVTFTTDREGYFFVPQGQVNDDTMVQISDEHYHSVVLPLKKGMVIALKPMHDDVGTIVLSLSELDADDGETQSTPGLLFSSGDAFSSLAGYSWGPYWFRQRGYQSSYTQVFMDGVNMAHPEKGYASWSIWGGLNDVTRNKETTYNIAPVDFSFSNIGGATNIITKPSQQRPGLKASYSLSNSSYSNRVMMTYSTGLMDNGWAFTVSGSRRWAQEGYVEGTSYDAWAGFFGAEKRFNENHSVQLTALIAPYKRGQQGATVQEIYDLKDNNLYNPYWGYQNGEKRNSRIKSSMIPQFVLNDVYKINERLKLKTAVGYSFGKEARTALNWYDAQDPRPDYYRYLPSFQYQQGNDIAGDLMTELWTNGSFGQLDFDHFYQINYNSIETNPDGDGEITGARSHYIIERRQNDIQNLDINPTLVWDVNDQWKLTTGLQYEYYLGNNYNTVEDLLGGDYYVDIDNFADRDFTDPDMASNDLLADSNIKQEGERIGHDYDAVINKASWWGQASKSFQKGSAYVGANLTNTSMYRYGNRMKGLFPENSYGKSEVLSFMDYGVKAGGEYFLTGRNVLTANGTYYTQAPYFQDAFVSVRTRNEAMENLVSSNVMSGDINYYYRGERFKGRVSAFYTRISDLTDVISYYDDSYNNFVNYALKGIGQEFSGIELGAEYQITDELRVKAAGTYAQYLYNANPLATTTVDNSAEKLSEGEIVYFDGYHVGGSPEIAGAVSVEYWSKNYWFVGLTANYLGKRYVTLNPARYTTRAINGDGYTFHPGSSEYLAIVDQEELDGAFTVDISAGKSWKIKDYIFRLNLNLNNVLNNENIVTTGFQQYRFDFLEGNPEKFDNKYYYAQGFRAFLNLSVSF
ncbi:TonB-dependent receptor [Persicobacter sp. CCB-QB2]|uniref:TonB-dependent receptor n=1 Tax=Persicobacter sp. CCB-QB2 TaxID=1561025 RepID=UPI000A4219A8|nr:TonB-dependent receptor [Persicobacter sp. CCB-QB2]